jgi:hypothetical protein
METILQGCIDVEEWGGEFPRRAEMDAPSDH